MHDPWQRRYVRCITHGNDKANEYVNAGALRNRLPARHPVAAGVLAGLTFGVCMLPLFLVMSVPLVLRGRVRLALLIAAAAAILAAVAFGIAMYAAIWLDGDGEMVRRRSPV